MHSKSTRPLSTQVNKQMTSSTLAPSVVAVLLASSAFAGPDLAITTKSTGGPQGETTSTATYSAKAVRTVDGNRETLVDLGTGKIVTIDHAKKEYYERTFDEIESMRKKVEEDIAAMTAQMPMAGAMGGGAAPSVSKPTDQKVNGIACQETKIESEIVASAVCVSQDVKLPVDAAAQKRLQLLRPQMRLMGPMAGALEAVAKVSATGFVVREVTTINMMGNVRETSREVTKIEEVAPVDVKVEAPVGYKKVDPPQPRRIESRGPGL